MFRRLVFISVLTTASAAAWDVKKTLGVAVDMVSKHANIARACGTLMHVPYVLTLDSQNPTVVRLAGILAALPTDAKLALKFVEKCDDRFFKVMLWDVPKFVAYSGAAAYDVINVLSPEHMIEERKAKGVALRRLKIDQAAALSIEFVLRVLACVASFKATDHADSQGGTDLNLVAELISEVADCAEVARLLGRYNSYATVPGCDIGFNFEINHNCSEAQEEDDGKNTELLVADKSLY